MLGRSLLLCEEVKRGMQGARIRGRDKAGATGLLKDAEALVQLVEQGIGVHNHPLSVDLLQKADKKLREALGMLKEVPPSP